MWLLLIESILGILALLVLMLVLRFITEKIKGDSFKYIPDTERMYLNNLKNNNNNDDDDDDYYRRRCTSPMYSLYAENIWNDDK